MVFSPVVSSGFLGNLIVFLGGFPNFSPWQQLHARTAISSWVVYGTRHLEADTAEKLHILTFKHPIFYIISIVN